MKNNAVLLVEDNPDDEHLTLRAFRKSNVENQITVARDGEEALDYLFGEGKYAGRDTKCQSGVVLLDLKLPKIDGIEVLRRLRADARTQLTPVVIPTTSAEERDVVNGYRAGANSYIRKPVDFQDFLRAVQQIGFYWLLLNEAIESK